MQKTGNTYDGKSRKGPKVNKKFEKTSTGRKTPGYQKDDNSSAIEYTIDSDLEKDFEKDFELIGDVESEESAE